MSHARERASTPVQDHRHLGLGSRATCPASEAAGLDAAQRHNLDARLMDIADRDPLTGLWNRTRFERDLAHQLDRCRRYNERAARFGADRFAVLLLDVDDEADRVAPT